MPVAGPPPQRIAEPLKRPTSQPGLQQPAGRVATPIPPERAPAPVQARPAVQPVHGRAPIVLPPDSTAFDLDDEPETTATKQQRQPRAPSQHELEMQVDELSGGGEEMLLEAGLDPAEANADEIAKILTETDVYIKYNLHQKAIDHLQRIYELDPRNVEAHEKLKDIYITLGRVADAASEMEKLVELCAPTAPDQAQAVLRELAGADPAKARALATKLRLPLPEGRAASPRPAPAPPAQLEDDSVDDFEMQVEDNTPVPLGVETSDIVVQTAAVSTGTLDFDLDDLGGAGVSEGTQEIDPEQLDVLGDDEGGGELRFDEGSVTSNSPNEAKTFDANLEDLDAMGLAGDADSPAAEREFELDPGDQAFDESMGSADAAPPVEEHADVAAPAGTSLEDDLDEADFFVSQNLFSEARAILSDLLGRYPNHPLVLAKVQDLDAQEHASAAPPPVAAQPAAPPPAKERSQTQNPAPAARKPTVIAKPLGEEDADTHYDLGLAYKEMGLHEEAIKEFMLVRDTPGRAVQCHLMIGLCHAERGKFTDAVNEFKSGLYVEGINDREALALYFELGAAYEALSDSREALYYYEKVYKRDPRFREIDKRIAAVKAGAAAKASAKNGSGGGGPHDEDSIDAALDILSDAPSGDFTPG
jgi:tetratricopeptide (TPR) repeat protein